MKAARKEQMKVPNDAMKPKKRGHIKQKLSSSLTSGYFEREIRRPTEVKTKQQEPNNSKSPSTNKTRPTV